MQQLIKGDYFEVDGPNGLDIVPMSLVKGTFAEIRDCHATEPRPVPPVLRAHCKNTVCWSARKRFGYVAKGETGPWAGFDGKHAKAQAERYLAAQPGAL